MQRYVVRPPLSDINDDNELYNAVSQVAQYFILNPTAPFVELVTDMDGIVKVIGRINNPALVGTIDIVHSAIYQHERQTAVRTVQIKDR